MIAQAELSAELWKLGPIVGSLVAALLYMYRRLEKQQEENTKSLQQDHEKCEASHAETRQKLDELMTESHRNNLELTNKITAIEAEARGIATGREIMERLSTDVLRVVSEANNPND